MRTIKFRVFAKVSDDDGCIGYLETRSPVASGIDFFYDGGWRGISYFLQHPDVFVVEQFTGQFDSMGVEIYEGDIVAAQKPNSYLDGEYLVEWNDNNARWSYKYNQYQIGSRGNLNATVIGNICNNPNFFNQNDDPS